MKKLKILAVCCLSAMLLSGCLPVAVPGATTVTSPPPASQAHVVPQPEQVRLPWFDKDTLNPYSCETLQNYYLAGLLCDPLVALDSACRPQNRLALEITGGPLQYSITLRHDAVFSDGAPLTPQDVLYSLGLAQNAPRFSGGLTGIATATVGSATTVIITLAAPDQFFTRSLVFPILRQDTGENPIPVGVGRFTAATEEHKLVRNERYYNPVKNIRQVTLVDTNSLEEQSYGIMEGTMDLMYSDLQSDLNLGLGIGYRQIPLSNMIYLGVGQKSPILTRELRQVLSGLTRREDIARKVFTGFATVTSLPVNPVAAATSLNVTDLEVNLEKQKAALEQMGWVAREDGSRWKDGVKLSLNILVNTESTERKAVAEQLTEMYRLAGVELVVNLLPFAQYQAQIASGGYDLCIAETRIAYNMNIAALLSPAGTRPAPAPSPGLSGVAAVPGVSSAPRAAPASGGILSLFYGVQAGTVEQATLEIALREELPVIPLLFRRGILCFSRDFSVNIVATEQDIFYNIGEW